MSRTIAIMGPPGAGKSALSLELARRFAAHARFAVRLLAQRLSQKDSELGRALVRSRARFLPDSLVEEIFAHFLASVQPADLVVLEGFPINSAQLEIAHRRLASIGRRIDLFVHLSAPREVLQRRVSERQVCPACEAAAASGVPSEAGATHCARCGGALVRRRDDRGTHFASRMALYRAESQRILKAVDAVRLVEMSSAGRSPEQICDAVHGLLHEVSA
jgi:adenylate kinase